jgi:hypothetical protein
MIQSRMITTRLEHCRHEVFLAEVGLAQGILPPPSPRSDG